MTIWFSANNKSSKTKKKPVLQFYIIALFQKSIKCFPFGYIWIRLLCRSAPRNDKKRVWRITFTPTLILPPQGRGDKISNPKTKN